MKRIPALEVPFELSADDTRIYVNSSGGERVRDFYNLMTGRNSEVIFISPESAKLTILIFSALGYLCNDIDGEPHTTLK